ncbi:MAG: TetR/AcrR family transcriptional regulator [Bacteroidetes bacterium]|nr:TetR/AcrR family transcriptional regulator [Bacteroidota bacterium]MBL6944155.1 TetR/AcrR family transcriptional regulator [Bacteroidales bacterium]
MPRTERQFKDIRELKRSQIMDSALHLFAQKGFDSTSINMIAKRAGISKGLIYNYFESKEDLITILIHNGFDKFFTEFDPNNDGVLTDLEFEHFIDKTFEVLKSNLHFWKLYFMVMAQPQVLKLVEKKLMELIIPLLTILSEYYTSKGIENPMAYARFFGAMIDGVCLNYIVDPENFPVEEIKQIIKNKFI